MTTKQINDIYQTNGAEGIQKAIEEKLIAQATRFTTIFILITTISFAVFLLIITAVRSNYLERENINHLVMEKLASDCQKKCDQINNSYCTGL